MASNKNHHDPHTFDLFSNVHSGAPRGGDGQTNQPAPSEPSPLPGLGDTELSVPEPFRVPGLTHPALRVPVFSIRLVRERDHLTRQIHTPADVARLCSETLDGLDREAFIAVALSTANRVIGLHVCHVGTVDASVASPREVYKFALLCNARSVVVAHNHPSGNLEPSGADVQVSRQLKQAGDVLGVRLLDSLVIGFDGAYTSLVERGLLS